MTRSEAVTVIANRLGQRTGMSTQIIEELKLAQIRLERSPELPWFLLVESSAFATGTTPGSTALPTGFLRESEDDNMLVQDENGEWAEVEKVSGSDGRIMEVSLAAAKPRFYSLFETYLRFWPDPDVSYNLYWPHYKAATTLATDVENAWLKYHPDVLICTAGIQMARFLRDINAVSLFDADLRAALGTMQTETTARREAGRRSWMGG